MSAGAARSPALPALMRRLNLCTLLAANNRVCYSRDSFGCPSGSATDGLRLNAVSRRWRAVLADQVISHNKDKSASPDQTPKYVLADAESGRAAVGSEGNEH